MRLDDQPRRRGRPCKGTAHPQVHSTTVSLPSTPPAVTEHLQRKVGRPRKVVIVDDASELIPSADDEAASERLPNHEQQLTRLDPSPRLTAVTPPPRVEQAGAPGATAGAGALVTTTAPSWPARSHITQPMERVCC